MIATLLLAAVLWAPAARAADDDLPPLAPHRPAAEMPTKGKRSLYALPVGPGTPGPKAGDRSDLQELRTDGRRREGPPPPKRVERHEYEFQPGTEPPVHQGELPKTSTLPEQRAD